MRAALLPALATALLAGCVTDDVRAEPGWARVGQTVTVGPVRVTPMTIHEDSRCPRGVQCVWAGRVRIQAKVGEVLTILSSGEAYALPGGSLTMVEVTPDRQADRPIARDQYRFRFRYTAS